MNPTAYDQPLALPISPKTHRKLLHHYLKRPGRRSRPSHSPYGTNFPAQVVHPTPLEKALEWCDKVDRGSDKPRSRIRLLREDVTGRRLPVNPHHRRNRAQRTRVQTGFSIVNKVAMITERDAQMNKARAAFEKEEKDRKLREATK